MSQMEVGCLGARQKTKQLQTRPNHKRSETIQIQCSPVLAEGPERRDAQVPPAVPTDWRPG